MQLDRFHHIELFAPKTSAILVIQVHKHAGLFEGDVQRRNVSIAVTPRNR
jgi:hypothetical protein